MLPKIKAYGLAAFLLLLAVFVLQNLASVEVNFLIWSAVVPRALLVVILFGLGVAMGWLLGYSGRAKP